MSICLCTHKHTYAHTAIVIHRHIYVCMFLWMHDCFFEFWYGCTCVQAFSTPWFLFASPTNHHLVFFLLEVFNNIIQYQFDGQWMSIFVCVCVFCMCFCNFIFSVASYTAILPLRSPVRKEGGWLFLVFLSSLFSYISVVTKCVFAGCRVFVMFITRSVCYAIWCSP